MEKVQVMDKGANKRVKDEIDGHKNGLRRYFWLGVKVVLVIYALFCLNENGIYVNDTAHI